MTPSAPAALRRDEVERVYRLGPAQAGMLFHDLATPDAAPYFRQVSFLLDGCIDPGRCEAAWNALMARHPLLRSAFDYERTAEPLQIVLRRRRIEFHWTDVTGPGASAAVEAWRRADARRGFDLRGEPLMRIALFRHGPARFEMVWSHPHILLDGWSGAILAEEFARVYAAGGSVAGLPPAPDPDAFMAARAARDGAAALRHWAGLLEGYAELATLPRRAGAVAPLDVAEPCLTLAEATSDALRALAAEHGATLGVLLQALWGLVLGRWTDRQDVVFGIVVSGRGLATPGVERLVGMFINAVPVRVRWEDQETIGDLLRRLQAQADAGADHDGAPLGAIQAAAGLPHLLDHLLVLENYPAGDVDEAATGFTVAGSAAVERSNYDFGLLVQAGPAIAIGLPHDAARFAPGLMARVARHVHTLVAAVLADPGRPLSEVDCLPDDERHAIAGQARGPRVTWPDDPTLADLWHAAADRTPDATALVAGHERLGYRALDGAAEGVADRLRAAGVGVGDAVAVLAGRGVARVAALLGILKAGAVYLPLSPSLPDGRIAFALEDAGCRRALADEAGAARLARLRPSVAMPIAGPVGRGRQGSTARADGLAYMIYTSGSTGRPKGVAIAHRGFVNMIRAQMRGFGLTPDDRVVQFASCSFDASLSEIFMALLAGACLVVAPEAAVRDGAALLALMAAEGVTVATLPPSYLRALDGADLGPLRVLITAGEPADTGDARHYAARLQTFNAYGPSEFSVCASWHRVDPDEAYPAGIPIGRPIANTALAVRDRAGRPMPFDAMGEICLSGAGLARGYVGLPALTDECFRTTGGERLYRTGDSGVMRQDGTVFYLGRRDGQVKLNGHRVELGEIEARLRADPAVSQAAAALAEDPPRLVAFVVPRGPFDPARLRQALAGLLPAWMVPSALLPVVALPRTVAGKVDRRALLAGLRADEAGSDAASLGPGERTVAAAFAAVLGGGPYGRDASFSAAGGDSLRAIRLLGRLRRDGFALDLRDLLAADSVAAMARAGRGDAGDDDRIVTGSLPLTPIQRWFFDRDPHGQAVLNHLVLLRCPAGPDVGEALPAAVDALYRHHDALRLVYARDGAGWTGHCPAPEAPFALRTVDLRDAADAWPVLRADALAEQPRPPGRGGPLFRATRYRLADADHLLLAAHHLLVDAVSWRIMLEDLETALRRAMAGEPVRLPGKTTSYRDWALALADPEVLEAAARERPYWEGVARGAGERVPVAAPPAGAATRLVVSADLGPVDPRMPDRRVLADLLARLGAALRACDGRTAALVMLSNHGRHPPRPGLDASRTVGWFTADFPFLLDCGATADAVEASLAAVPSHGMGWGVLRWLGDHPVVLPEPEVSLNYLGTADPPPEAALVPCEGLPEVTRDGLPEPRSIEIEVGTTAGRLDADFRYAPARHPSWIVEGLIAAMSIRPASHLPPHHSRPNRKE